ncbi:hypothetical protein GCM10023195_04160 [Actinoallomurus liliacearum]|uniref:Oxidoreductase FAD/NAD(P)-binding domain-containing protein n=2 Tax=Actinoallomurus liliacearum TaxID=1080073 RepID=A0ABP8TDF1_9ACTN
MLAHLAATGSTRQVIAVHADRSQRTHAFRDELGLLVDKLPRAEAHIWYERPEVAWPAGRTGLADLSGIDIPEDTRAYLCGPVPFMRSIRSQLLDLGVPADRIHYELFGPDLGLATAA